MPQRASNVQCFAAGGLVALVAYLKVVVYDAVTVEGEFADADGVADTGVVAVGAASG